VRSVVVVLLLLSELVGPPLQLPVAAQEMDVQSGSILAVSGIQVVWLDLGAPRPRQLSKLSSPAGATHVEGLVGFDTAVASVATAFPGGGPRGADLDVVDLSSGSMTQLLSRTAANESFVMPTWWPDGRSVIFEREDLEGQTVGAPGQEVPRYPSRIEVADADGNNRWILEQTGREPSVAPDGSRVVFARTSNRGASLLSWENGSGAEQILVPEGKFADVAYPHFSPDGNQIAFVAPESGLGATDLVTARTVDAQLLGGWLAVGPMVAEAHGIPWDPWIMNADGSALRRAAVVGGDEPSVSWSPDGSQLFVYGGTGSAVVDARTGDAIQLSFVKGYGPTTWLPMQP
jgi:Tol biopolymer transport system component